jgi:hypothetical protein
MDNMILDNIADDIAHAYQDGFNDGLKSVAQQRIETGIYDIEEVHPNCTVQIWRNSQTGEESIGWWENE